MIGRTNAGGGGLGKSTLAVQTESGSVVTVSKGTETRNAVERYGVWTFPGLAAGEWTVQAVKDGRTATKTVTMDGTDFVAVSLVYSKIPEFTYTGDYETVDDDDNPITTSDGNWKIRFLTSGVFTPIDLRGAENGIDVFLVGGGGGGEYNASGGGGGGGRTADHHNLKIAVGISYAITIGAGGEQNTNGGSTSAFGITVLGGEAGNDNGNSSSHGGYGGSGGSGGGAGGANSVGAGGDDGSDGGDAQDASWGTKTGGKGQGTTTREFGEPLGKLYSGGGGGSNRLTAPQGIGGTGAGNGAGNGQDATPGTENTGGGGGGASSVNAPSKAAAKGGSGIVIIRNAREVA